MSEPVISIRPHRDGDQDGVAAVISPIQTAEFGIPITLADQPDLADVEGFYRRGAGEFWVAVDDQTIVGTIALIDLGGGQGVIRKMFVRASHRGPQHKLAKRLLDHLEAHAKAAGMTALSLGTTDKFLAAHRFYEREGFALIDPNDLPPGFPRMAVDTRFYIKPLN